MYQEVNFVVLNIYQEVNLKRVVIWLSYVNIFLNWIQNGTEVDILF
jgi:hypothetical protein